MFIYVIRHKVTGREYVGKTVEPLSYRLSGHRSRARRGSRSPLHHAMVADGVEAFEMELLATATTHEELWTLEKRFIAERNTVYPHGYNLVRGGRGNYGWQMPEETRQKISAARIGQEPWNRGQKMPASFGEAMSRARKGQPKTDAQLAAVRTPHAKAASAKTGRLNRGRRMDPVKWSNVQRRVQAEMPDEAKAVRNQKVADSKRAWWASLTPKERSAHVQKMKRGQTAAQESAQL